MKNSGIPTPPTAPAPEPSTDSGPSNFIRTLIEEDLRAGKNDGRVATRFPPEPNGYLHIGHAKSICLNFGLARDYNGTCNLRFDDTNPAKENAEYVASIQTDVRWLGFDWEDRLHFASDYFEALYGYAVALIQAGKAYVCSLSADQIREYRGTLTEPGRPSPYRDRSIAENLDLFTRMRAGEFADGSHVLRAKIDMAAANLVLRDPTLYRIRRLHHHRTADRWCIYPMYDFTHCLSDAIEGITHSVCTMEFENNRALYDWVLENLEVPCHPQQIEFARLNLTHTVLSKRKLIELVEKGFVSGWDDPRMPTISGLRRRGYPAEAIRTFCERIGVAKRESTVDIALLEHCVRENLNASAHVGRYAVALLPGIDDEFACGGEVVAGGMKTAFDFGAEAALDFDGPQAAVGPGQQQVDFGAAAGAVEVALCRVAGADEQVFDDETFPAMTDDRVRQQGFLVGDCEQGMGQAAVSHVYLGRFDQALAEVGMPGRQAAHDEEVDQQVEIAGGGLGVHSKVAGELGGVEQPALMVGQHAPEAAQSFGGDTRAELRDVAFQIGADEVLAPAQAARAIGCEQAVGKATAHPKIVGRQVGRFQHAERRQFQIGNAAGQALAGLLEKVERSEAQQQVLPCGAPGPAGAVDQPAQYRKQPRRTVDFIEYDQLVLVICKVELGLLQLGAVLLGFEVEIKRVKGLTHFQGQGGLADLARAQQRDCRGVGEGILESWGELAA